MGDRGDEYVKTRGPWGEDWERDYFIIHFL